MSISNKNFVLLSQQQRQKVDENTHNQKKSGKFVIIKIVN